ncbi:hypothetical protein FCV25MIE_02356 [Fagus crenata]
MDSSYQTGSWTNEKHVRFLNTMEASFVRAMFENNDDDQILRLDRYLPDSSDSTLDLKKQRRKKHVSQVGGTGNMVARARMDSRADRRTRRLSSSQPCIPSQDQVVPQFDSITVGDKDQRDPLNLSKALAPVS